MRGDTRSNVGRREQALKRGSGMRSAVIVPRAVGDQYETPTVADSAQIP
jgi:hypothetical protein